MTNKKIEKGALITTIILLVIFVPLTSLAIYFHHKGVSSTKENVNHELYFDNKLWFYDKELNLLGTYNCETTSCGLANSNSEDELYAIDSLKSRDTDLGIINNHFVFLNDGENKNFLYNIASGQNFKANAYLLVNNYGVGIEGDLYIVKNQNNKYGVLELKDNAVPKITFQYDFIGLKNDTDENGQILADYFIAKKDDLWLIMSANEAVLTTNIDREIVSFTGTEVIVKNSDETYSLVDYQGNTLLSEDFKNIKIIDKYMGLTTTDNEFYLYDTRNDLSVSDVYQINDTSVIEGKINEDGLLDLYIDNDLKESIERNNT